MRRRIVLAVTFAASLAGCTDMVGMTPVNNQAQAAGSPQLRFFRGFPAGPMNVTMPNGEVLTGSFSVSEGSPATVPDADGGGNFRASVHGPRTTLVCRGNLVAGHGPGECRGQDGSVYRMDL